MTDIRNEVSCPTRARLRRNIHRVQCTYTCVSLAPRTDLAQLVTSDAFLSPPCTPQLSARIATTRRSSGLSKQDVGLAGRPATVIGLRARRKGREHLLGLQGQRGRQRQLTRWVLTVGVPAIVAGQIGRVGGRHACLSAEAGCGSCCCRAARPSDDLSRQAVVLRYGCSPAALRQANSWRRATQPTIRP